MSPNNIYYIIIVKWSHLYAFPVLINCLQLNIVQYFLLYLYLRMQDMMFYHEYDEDHKS